MNEILNFRIKNSQLEYLIKWTRIEKNSWIKFVNMINVIKIMNVYHARNSDHLNRNSWIAYVQKNSDFEYELENWKSRRSFDFKKRFIVMILADVTWKMLKKEMLNDVRQCYEWC